MKDIEEKRINCYLEYQKSKGKKDKINCIKSQSRASKKTFQSRREYLTGGRKLSFKIQENFTSKFKIKEDQITGGILKKRHLLQLLGQRFLLPLYWRMQPEHLKLQRQQPWQGLPTSHSDKKYEIPWQQCLIKRTWRRNRIWLWRSIGPWRSWRHTLRI